MHFCFSSSFDKNFNNPSSFSLYDVLEFDNNEPNNSRTSILYDDIASHEAHSLLFFSNEWVNVWKNSSNFSSFQYRFHKKKKKKWVTYIAYNNIYAKTYVKWPLSLSVAMISVGSGTVAMEARSFELELVMFENSK